LIALNINDFRGIIGSFDLLNLSLVLVNLEAFFAVALRSIYAYYIRMPEFSKLSMAKSARVLGILLNLSLLYG
jgi:hypothetical protein